MLLAKLFLSLGLLLRTADVESLTFEIFVVQLVHSRGGIFVVDVVHKAKPSAFTCLGISSD